VGELGGGCVAESVSAFSQEILDIFVTEIESIVEPDRVGSYIWRELVTLTGIHGVILATSPS
jgi:hypothetical protein